jgi:hypothetical protein
MYVTVSETLPEQLCKSRALDIPAISSESETSTLNYYCGNLQAWLKPKMDETG